MQEQQLDDYLGNSQLQGCFPTNNLVMIRNMAGVTFASGLLDQKPASLQEKDARPNGPKIAGLVCAVGFLKLNIKGKKAPNPQDLS